MRLGLVGRFELIAGRGGLTHPVAWVNAISGTNASSYQPSPDELVLLTRPYGNWPLAKLAACGAAGVLIQSGSIPRLQTEWAEGHDFPIISLNADADVAEVQRSLLRLLVDKEAGIVAQKAEIYQRLTRLSVENQGLAGIAHSLVDLTHNGIVIQDKRLQLLAAEPPYSPWPLWSTAVDTLLDGEMLPDDFQDRRHAGRIREPIEQPIVTGGARLIMPISVRDIARGFMSIVSPSGQFGPLDRIALEQGAAACALEMAKAKAVSEVRKKLIGDLVEAILSHRLAETDAGRWADRAGYRRAGPHVAMTLQWMSAGSPSLRRLETILSGEIKRIPGRAVALPRENEIVVFYAPPAEAGLSDAMIWAERIHGLAAGEFPSARLGLGVGHLSSDLLGLAQSYQEARQAMRLEGKLRRGRPQYFGDLGTYRLLLPLNESGELRRFVEEILGGVLEYDRAKGGNLIETLRAYFEHNANLVQTAQALYLHRNTLLYRLQRASEIGGFDLDNSDTRLALQLALRGLDLIENQEAHSG